MMSNSESRKREAELASMPDRVRCPECMGLDGVHGLVHRRHEAGGGGSNVPCSRPMTSLSERIEAVLAEHRFTSAIGQDQACTCGWEDGYMPNAYDLHRAHVAAVLTALLAPTDAPRVCEFCHDGRNLATGWECSGCGRTGDVERAADAPRDEPRSAERSGLVDLIAVYTRSAARLSTVGTEAAKRAVYLRCRDDLRALLDATEREGES